MRVKLDETQRIYNTKKRKMLREGIPFNITKETFIEIKTAPCAYCGAPPSETHVLEYYKGRAHRTKTLFNQIDRINPGLGYVEGNVQPLCRKCNWIKSNYSEDFLASHLQKILSFREAHYGETL